MEEKPVGLETLNGGAAIEMFDSELRKVLENIQDPNTTAKARRTINLKVSLVPAEDRRMGGVEISVNSKLVAPRGNAAVVFFGRIDGQSVAVQNDPSQGKLFDQPSPGVKLVSMRKE